MGTNRLSFYMAIDSAADLLAFASEEAAQLQLDDMHNRLEELVAELRYMAADSQLQEVQEIEGAPA